MWSKGPEAENLSSHSHDSSVTRCFSLYDSVVLGFFIYSLYCFCLCCSLVFSGLYVIVICLCHCMWTCFDSFIMHVAVVM